MTVIVWGVMLLSISALVLALTAPINVSVDAQRFKACGAARSTADVICSLETTKGDSRPPGGLSVFEVNTPVQSGQMLRPV